MEKKTAKKKNVKNKTTSKKTTSKKTTTNKKKLNKEEKFYTSTKFLMMIFISLLVLVMILTVVAIKTKKDYNSEVRANFVIPIIKVNDTIEFSINARDLALSKGYVFKVKNYRSNQINKEEIKYGISVENKTGFDIEMYKNKEKENLVNDQDNIMISEKLKKDEEDMKYYTIKMKTDKKKPKKNELINIKITTKK